MASAATSWHITGDYFENCNCDVVCPCLFSPNAPMTGRPTQGFCNVAFGFHVERGNYGSVSLDGLNVALVGHAPGAMADGNLSLGAYLDDRADESQRQALQAIFTGSAGGPMALLAPLFTQVLGITPAPITFGKDGTRRTLEIPGIAHLAVHAIPNAIGEDAMWVVNAHPFNPAGLALAVGESGSTWDGYDLHLDNSGKNGHYAPITWSNA